MPSRNGDGIRKGFTVNIEAVTQIVEQAKSEIRADMAEGVVPRTVDSFAALHDYVDANLYGLDAVDLDEVGIEEINEAQDRVSAWLRVEASRNALGAALARGHEKPWLHS